MDPSPDVIEMIREQAYANSTTIDGRKFTDDFVKRRKEDAIRRAVTHTSSDKLASLAEGKVSSVQN